jgi:hypothetical protein
MGFLKNLNLWLSPPKLADPDFGTMVFMHISKFPERSYWECEWRFPPTGNIAVITLRGDESGPQPEFRRFYLGLPGRFNEILAACRPVLEEVYRDELQKALPTDILTALKVAGFRVEDPNEQPVHWEVSFESTSDEYLGISIPFAGELALAPEVDIC